MKRRSLFSAIACVIPFLASNKKTEGDDEKEEMKRHFDNGIRFETMVYPAGWKCVSFCQNFNDDQTVMEFHYRFEKVQIQNTE